MDDEEDDEVEPWFVVAEKAWYPEDDGGSGLDRVVPVMPDSPASVDDNNDNLAAAEACRDREGSGDEDVSGEATESTTDGRETEERSAGAVVVVIVLWTFLLLLFKGIGGERVVVQFVEAAALGSLSSLSIVVVSAKVVAVLVILSASGAVAVVVVVVVVVMVTVEIVVRSASEKASTMGSWARAAARSSDATVVEMVRYFRAGGGDD